jgi:hypothetical protein
MKGTTAILLGTLTIGAALVLPGVSLAQAPGELARQRENHFPVMHAAIQQLEQTKQALASDAGGDFHGHKTNAINHINAAIQELRAGIQEERKH